MSEQDSSAALRVGDVGREGASAASLLKKANRSNDANVTVPWRERVSVIDVLITLAWLCSSVAIFNGVAALDHGYDVGYHFIALLLSLFVLISGYKHARLCIANDVSPSPFGQIPPDIRKAVRAGDLHAMLRRAIMSPGSSFTIPEALLVDRLHTQILTIKASLFGFKVTRESREAWFGVVRMLSHDVRELQTRRSLVVTYRRSLTEEEQGHAWSAIDRSAVELERRLSTIAEEAGTFRKRQIANDANRPDAATLHRIFGTTPKAAVEESLVVDGDVHVPAAAEPKLKQIATDIAFILDHSEPGITSEAVYDAQTTRDRHIRDVVDDYKIMRWIDRKQADSAFLSNLSRVEAGMAERRAGVEEHLRSASAAQQLFLASKFPENINQSGLVVESQETPDAR